MSTGPCPVCAGSARRPCPPNLRDYGVKYGWYGYDAHTDTVDCNNCGAQYQWGNATGSVRLNQHGEPCVHEYTSQLVSRCYTKYTCTHCGDEHHIDSGD